MDKRDQHEIYLEQSKTAMNKLMELYWEDSENGIKIAHSLGILKRHAEALEAWTLQRYEADTQ